MSLSGNAVLGELVWLPVAEKECNRLQLESSALLKKLAVLGSVGF